MVTPRLMSQDRRQRTTPPGARCGAEYLWRRERDSNPRYPSGYSGFQDHRHRPLGHLSVTGNSRTPARVRNSRQGSVYPAMAHVTLRLLLLSIVACLGFPAAARSQNLSQIFRPQIASKPECSSTLGAPRLSDATLADCIE